MLISDCACGDVVTRTHKKKKKMQAISIVVAAAGEEDCADLAPLLSLSSSLTLMDLEGARGRRVG